MLAVEFDKGKILYPLNQEITVLIEEQTQRKKEIFLNRIHANILVSGYAVKYWAAIVKREHAHGSKVRPGYTSAKRQIKAPYKNRKTADKGLFRSG